MRTNWSIASVALMLVLLATATSQAAVQFYFDKDAWMADAHAAACFPFTAANVELSPDVMQPVTNGTSLGACLDFPAAQTGLTTDFTICATQSGYELVFQDYSPDLGPNLAPGGSGQTDDDWSVSWPSAGIYAFGATIVDNNESFESGELFTVYGDDWSASITSDDVGHASWPHGGPATGFIGVISTEPIFSTEFDEGTSADDNAAISEVCFGVPEPATAALIGVGGLVLSRRRRVG